VSEPEASRPRDSFPKILRTGSMLKLVTELVEDVPARLGAYRVLGRIGEGGMGVVYLAEQDPPLVRRVAIKLARNAVPGDRALARFESERQTLAVMNHPNIARVFDAGSAPDARPYFVMEYVAGESITEYCDSRQLGIEPRLELFLRVCEGVQHAHLNAVIHRDLKPPNILVTTEGGGPTPKIIDFGVAKALHDGAGPTNGLTQFGQLVGTPEYMSPEQAALDGRSVDSRTDVYSLGVVLYELLVGGRPFERETGPSASFVDLCRRIREQEPERPSVRAQRPSAADAARRLQLGPPALARWLRGDLDAIVVKALAKDPRSRYATPSDMAADIERHLHHRPIHAQPPGPLVRLRKAFRRHRAAALVVAALSATLIGLAILGTAQALRAHRESERAEAEARIGNEVRKFVVGVIDPPGALGSYEVREALLTSRDRDAILNRIREQFADQPLLQSQLLFAVGQHLITSTRSGREIATLEESRDRITSLLGPDSAEALAANETLARTITFNQRFPEAERILLEVLERRQLAGTDDPDTWRTRVHLATLYKWSQRHEEAARLFEAAIAGLERRLGPNDPDVLSTTVGLSGSYLELRRYPEAQDLLERAIDRIRRVFGERSYQTQIALYNLACAHANSGRREVALDYLRRATAIGWAYPEGPAEDPQLLPLHGDPRFDELDREERLNVRERWATRLDEAQSWMRVGRLADAERLLRDLIAAIERVDQTGAGGRAIAPRLALATCWIRQRRFEDADRLLVPTLAAAQAARSDVDGHAILDLLAQCDIGRGRQAPALARIAAAGSHLQPQFDNVEKTYETAESQALLGRDEDALRTLARASELGFDDVERLEHDLAFAKLRGRAEFVTIAGAARRRAL
jgi:non-specific serine/threonine protein kinase/serine/threonine-protein kinase